jgi:hypothetical protein
MVQQQLHSNSGFKVSVKHKEKVIVTCYGPTNAMRIMAAISSTEQSNHLKDIKVYSGIQTM